MYLLETNMIRFEGLPLAMVNEQGILNHFIGVLISHSDRLRKLLRIL